MQRRFRKLRKTIVDGIDKQDALGLRLETPFQINVERQAWRFLTDAQKTQAFRRWLEEQVELGVLETTLTGKPWTNEFIESAYRKGVVRAYIDTRRESLAAEDFDFIDQSQEQFLREAFSAPETVQKLESLYTRTFDELRGVTQAMGQEMGRILSDGLAAGLGPGQIARNLSNSITGITRRRANVIARTEVIRAHAEGQLDSFEKMGVDEVGVLAEWATAQDSRVCPMCQPLHGVVMTVQKARGLLPRHPNCRCAWLPAFKDIEDEGQKRSEEEVKGAVEQSLKAEGRSVSRSRWLGKTKKFTGSPRYKRKD